MKSKMFNETNRENILKSFGFEKSIGAIKMGCCASCGVSVEESDFRNPISIKEFHISGMCQHCQDSIFGED